ncbi:MAG: heme peroxidase family protein [Vicinamibacterales bacterium]
MASPRPELKHGSELRGLVHATRSSTTEGRFGRLFRWLPAAAFSEAALLALARTMIQQEFDERRKNHEPLDTPLDAFEPEDENPTITAGYTYVGQFVDHDITFDPVSSLDRQNDPDALTDFRTPRLDLDSVYGMGPDHQPYLYHADGRRLLVGSDKSFDGSGAHPDLPRNGGSPRRALIGDKRNDENLIVSQLHATFLRFHNAVVDRLEHANVPASRLFDEAQRLVRWHYQWAILHDFLPAIVGDDMARAVREGDHGRPDLRLFRPVREAFMPVEFSAAAYRFGHSMVRPSYSLNTVARQATGGADVFHRIPIFSADAGPQANLNGFREIPDGWAVDWSFFFKGLPTPPGSDGLALPQPSYRMDTVLVDPLAALPEFAGGPADRAILAFRNLLRGWRLGLPSGQSVARFLGMTPLPDDLLFEDRAGFEGVNRHQVYTAYRSEFTRQAPLWYYLLKEAELTRRHDVPDPEGGGHHLGAVGGRIVAEVLVGLVWHDRHSYLRAEERWKPELVGDTFSLADLIRVAATAH